MLVEQVADMGLVEGTPLTAEKMNVEYFTGVLIYTVVFLIVLAMIRLQGRGLLGAMYGYFFVRKKDSMMLPEGLRQNYLLIFLSVCLSFSALAMLLAFFSGSPFSFSTALLYFLVLMGYYVVLAGVVRLFGWTFNEQGCATEIIFNMRISAVVFGLSASPFILALFYVKPSKVEMLLYGMVVLGGMLLVFRLIRLIKILYGYRVSILYMILYLCGLEILPMLVLYKLLA